MAERHAVVGCEHFALPVVELARDLIGRTLSVGSGHDERRGTIVETEAYAGRDDPASHAAFRPGGRAALMRGPPGRVYVYAAYGVYPCLNIVAQPEGEAAAVLIRGILPQGAAAPILGPGRVSRAFGITLADHGESACGERFGVSAERTRLAIARGPRVGITRGVELAWRFVGTALDTGA